VARNCDGAQAGGRCDAFRALHIALFSTVETLCAAPHPPPPTVVAARTGSTAKAVAKTEGAFVALLRIPRPLPRPHTSSTKDGVFIYIVRRHPFHPPSTITSSKSAVAFRFQCCCIRCLSTFMPVSQINELHAWGWLDRPYEPLIFTSFFLGRFPRLALRAREPAWDRRTK
jgi:hypothetical protein